MARMTRAEFEAFVRDAINNEVSASTPCACCGGVTVDGVDEAVTAIGSRFEDADSDAFFAGRNQGQAEEIDRNDASQGW